MQYILNDRKKAFSFPRKTVYTKILYQKCPQNGYPNFQRVDEVGLQTGSKLPGCESQAMSRTGLLCLLCFYTFPFV